MKKLENKTVFITGGLFDIRKACALAAAKEGTNIAIADLKSDGTDKAMEEIRKENSKAIFIECDVSVFAQTQTAIEKTISTFKTLDIALNDVSIELKPTKIDRITKKEWLNVIGINLNKFFNFMRHELAQMSKQKKGVIVNNSSILGKVGFATSSQYATAKQGVIGLTQTAALEYATEGIRVNAICPGFVDTPLLTKDHINSHTDVRQHNIDLYPMKRLDKAEEIADGFIFLASDESSFMSGTAVEIDGGYLAIYSI